MRYRKLEVQCIFPSPQNMIYIAHCHSGSKSPKMSQTIGQHLDDHIYKQRWMEFIHHYLCPLNQYCKTGLFWLSETFLVILKHCEFIHRWIRHIWLSNPIDARVRSVTHDLASDLDTVWHIFLGPKIAVLIELIKRWSSNTIHSNDSSLFQNGVQTRFILFMIQLAF